MHSAVLLPNGFVLLTGGYTNQLPINAAELYTGGATSSGNMAWINGVIALLPEVTIKASEPRIHTKGVTLPNVYNEPSDGFTRVHILKSEINLLDCDQLSPV